MDWNDTPEPLRERQEDAAIETGQLSVYADENWEQLDIDHRTREERDAARVFDCAHCGDGDALRVGDVCPYCDTSA
jgi:hypothetical protein